MKKPIKKPAKKTSTKKFKYEISTDYLRKVYSVEDFARMIPAAVKKIKAFRKKHPFDAIAFTGTSGAAAAFTLSYKLKIPVINVRKGKTGSHYYRDLEGCINAKKYLIVDDFIESGTTMNRIIRTIKDNIKAAPVGIFLYSDASYMTRQSYDGIPIFRLMRNE